MFYYEFCENFKSTFFLRAPYCGHFCATLPNMNNSKTFLIDFYYWFQNSCYPFHNNAFNSSYLSYYLFFEIAIFLNSYFSEQAIFLNCHLQEQPPEGFYKKVVLKILQYSQENTRQGCNFIKKRLQHRCFPVNIAKFLRTVI